MIRFYCRHQTRYARYLASTASPQPSPLYMAAGLLPPAPIMPTTLRLDWFAGTIYSALSRNLATPTTETFKVSIIWSCPFEWKGTLMMKVPTASLSGHWLFSIVGDICRRRLSTRMNGRDLLQIGREDYNLWVSLLFLTLSHA